MDIQLALVIFAAIALAYYLLHNDNVAILSKLDSGTSFLDAFQWGTPEVITREPVPTPRIVEEEEVGPPVEEAAATSTVRRRAPKKAETVDAKSTVVL
jgi:hypothetical protein